MTNRHNAYNGRSEVGQSDSWSELENYDAARERDLELIANIPRDVDTNFPYSGVHRAEDPIYKLERSPRLENGYRGQLDAKQELAWYREEVTKNLPERVKMIDEMIDQDPLLNDLPADLEAIVAMPVGAAYESENIYNTFARFNRARKVDSETGEADLDKVVFLLNVNWTGLAIEDPEKAKLIEKTISEIDRMKQDFPELNISVVNFLYDVDKFKETGGAIGHIVQDSYHTSLLALDRAVQQDKLNNPNDVVIIRQDADALHTSVGFIGQFTKAAKENPEVDVFQGVTRHDLGLAETHPGFSIITNFEAALQVQTANSGDAHIGNHNYAMRVSTFAATGGIGMDELKYTGAFTDDTVIGRRMKSARGLSTESHNPNSNTRVTKGVPGAHLHSSPDRMEKEYEPGGGDVTGAWKTFSDGADGYSERTVVESDLETVEQSLDRIEVGITSLLNKWSVVDPEQVNRNLVMFFDAGLGGRGYELSADEEGRVEFKLNDYGREALAELLARDEDGMSAYSRRAEVTASRMA